MKTPVTIKVLWVEDDNSIIESYALIAEENYDITLDVASNWDEAEIMLKSKFQEYSAIILDANCKLHKEDKMPSKFFLGYASVRMSMIFGQKHKFIPWYVLSAGTMESFDVVLSLIDTDERKQMSADWGELLYKKDSNCDKLFENIKKVADNNYVNTVLFRHADVFKYLGKDGYIGYDKARKSVLKMLSAMYYPEENLNYEYEGNPLRHVVEYIFRTANNFGILPDDCFDKDDQMVVLDASRYLAGLCIKCYDKKNKRDVKYYSRIKSESEAVFSKEDAEIVRCLINYSNACSHTQNIDSYIIDEDKKEIFFGYVLQLCHIIKIFGRYLENHQNIEANKSMQETLNAPQKDEKATITIDDTGEVALVSPICKIHRSMIKKKGSEVQIESVSINNEDDSDRFPFFAKVKPVEGKKQESKSKIELNSEIPKRESLEGCEGVILLGGDKGHIVKLGGFCKLSAEYKKDIGKKARIISLEDNKDSDSKEIPYIATKVELI